MRRSLTLLGALLFAVTAAATDRPIRFQHLTVDDGLSQSTVLAVHQDSVGFIWLGTEDGLNRFDGHGFVHYQTSRSSGMTSDYIVAIAEDDSGDLWLGTDGGGLLRWDRSTDTFRRIEAGDGSRNASRVRAVVWDPAGAVWFGTRGAGLYRYDLETEEVTTYRHDPELADSLADDGVYGLLLDSNGVLWVATNAGLCQWVPERGVFLTHRHDPANPESLASDRVRSLFEDRSGGLWVGTADAGLHRFDRVGGSFRRFQHDPDDPRSLAHDRVRAVFEDDAGRLWIGTSDGLDLMEPDGESFVHYRHDPADPASLRGSDVMSLAQDRGGVLWVGTTAGGVSRWNPVTWSFGHVAPRTDEDGLSNPIVTAFTVDSRDRLWVGSFGGGVDVFDRRTGRTRHLVAGDGTLTSDRVMALLADRRGDVWVGTFDGGVVRVDPDTFESTAFTQDDDGGLPVAGVMSLAEAADGAVWVGTFGGGLCRFEPSTRGFVVYPPEPDDPSGLGSGRVTTLAAMPDGRLWVGTDGAGLHLFDPATGEFRRFKHDANDPSSLGSDTVLALHLEPSGRLWIGSRGGGLATLSGPPTNGDADFRPFGTDDGLPDDVVYGIEADTAGGLWLSTNRGLSRFDPRTAEFRNFDHTHGLQSDEFNVGAHFRSGSGELFFGGVNGFNAFYPEQLERNTFQPPIVFTNVLVADRPLVGRAALVDMQSVELGYRDDVVSFEFAALDFNDPSRTRYAYQLEGLHDDWIDLGPNHRVTFTDLDGGDYTLRIRSANNDGVWTEQPLQLGLAVAYPPWKSRWAYLLYTVVIVGSVAGAWHHQRRKLEREEEYSMRLESDVADRTKELEQRTHKLEEANRALSEASLTDALTGLRNRRFLFEEVAKDIALIRRRYVELSRGSRDPKVLDVVFLMVDLDNFKEINDSFGHLAGDQVLRGVRDRLLKACRRSDIVIRWGGDEFLVVGRDADTRDAQAIAERIRVAVGEEAFSLDDGQVVRTTCSVGYACFPFDRATPDLMDWEEVLSLADNALYRAKERRNAWAGFVSTLESVNAENLYRRLRDEPDAMVDEGMLEIVESSRS